MTMAAPISVVAVDTSEKKMKPVKPARIRRLKSSGARAAASPT